MKDYYKSAFDKLTLREDEKEKIKALYDEANRKDKGGKEKRTRTPFIAAAACAAVILLVCVVPALRNNGLQKTVSSGGAANPVSGSQPGGGSDAVHMEKYFSVTAYGKELTKGGKVFPDKYSSVGYILEESPEKKLSFSFEFPMQCKGENIDAVTYKIEKGAFHIMMEREKADEGKNGGGRPDKIDSVIAAGEKMEEGDECYKSFTVKYEDQFNEKVHIQVIDTDDFWTEEKMSQYKGLDYHMEDASIREEKELFDFLTKDLGITCTATYKDGSAETKNIVISNEIVKASELFPDEEIPEEEDKMVAKYFSIQ